MDETGWYYGSQSAWAVDDCPGTLGDFGVLHWQVIGGDLNFAFSCDGHQRSETGWQVGQNLDRTIICKPVEFYTGNFYSSKRSHPARKNNWFVVVAVFWAVDHDLKQMGQRGSVLNGDMCSTPSSCLKGYWTFLDIGVVGVVGVDFRKCMQWGGEGGTKMLARSVTSYHEISTVLLFSRPPYLFALSARSAEIGSGLIFVTVEGILFILSFLFVPMAAASVGQWFDCCFESSVPSKKNAWWETFQLRFVCLFQHNICKMTNKPFTINYFKFRFNNRLQVESTCSYYHYQGLNIWLSLLATIESNRFISQFFKTNHFDTN